MLTQTRIDELNKAAASMIVAARTKTSRTTTYAVPDPEDGNHLAGLLREHGEAEVLEQLPSMGGYVVHFTLADTDHRSHEEALESQIDELRGKLTEALRQNNALILSCRSLHDYLSLSISGGASGAEVSEAFRLARIQFKEAVEAVPALAALATAG